MSGTLTRPNSNPILDMMRDMDTGDMWGTAIAVAFAVADVLYNADPNEVPPELGYRPGMGGPEVPSTIYGDTGEPMLGDVSYETCVVWEYLHDADVVADPASLPYWTDPTFAGRVAELRFAGRCLHRYLDWLRAAGKDY